MTLYNFLEELFARGGDLKAVTLVNAEPRVGTGILTQTISLLEDFNKKSLEEQISHRGNRRFGFDKLSRIGELEVSLLKRTRGLSGERVEIGVSLSLSDQHIMAERIARQVRGV